MDIEEATLIQITTEVGRRVDRFVWKGNHWFGLAGLVISVWSLWLVL